MKIKNILKKTKENLINNFHLKPYEIAFASVFIALWLVSSRFLTINLTIMRIGITYVWMILISLTTRPILGIFTLIIGDTLSLFLSGNIGYWMPTYFVIPIIIYFICYLFKKLAFQRGDKTWWIIIIASLIFVVLTTFFVFLFNQNFIKISRDLDTNINFSSLISRIIIWTILSLMVLFEFFLLIFYYFKRKDNIKVFLNIYALVSVVIVICIWVMGPINQVLFLNRFSTKKTNNWNAYSIFLIPRILKTIVILPLYTSIIFPIYKVSQTTSKNKHLSKW